MKTLTVREFDTLVDSVHGDEPNAVPSKAFAWLEAQSLAVRAGEAAWARPARRDGRRAVQVLNYVGVVRAPDGTQIEILPKTSASSTAGEARATMIEMLRALPGFSHIRTSEAQLLAARMPLLEVFIAQFLAAVDHVVKRGLRSDYQAVEANLPALRGKLLMATHLRCNVVRRDRFYAVYDEFGPNRPENRLLKAALDVVLGYSRSREHQRLARELAFVFAEIPPCADVKEDLKRIRLDRGMSHYDAALAWARLILAQLSPVSGSGTHDALSLLFPMEKLFEAYVARHLGRQLADGVTLSTQARTHHLVEHQAERWFWMKPDLVLHMAGQAVLVLDTKWKVLDGSLANGRDKYGLSQEDFYQLYAYGQHYLAGAGEVVLVYPKTSGFTAPLAAFGFPQAPGLSLHVVPFCLKERRFEVPGSSRLGALLRGPMTERSP